MNREHGKGIGKFSLAFIQPRGNPFSSSLSPYLLLYILLSFFLLFPSLRSSIFLPHSFYEDFSLHVHLLTGFPRNSFFLSLARARISSRLPILFESSARNPSVVLLIMPAESSPVPISSCLQGQLISSTRYYEYSRFSFFLVHLSLAASTLFPLVVVILVVVVLIVVSLSGQPFPVILAARWRRFKAY